jgi:hypothetical protein
MCTISADFLRFYFFAEFYNGKDIVKNICYNSFIMATRIQTRRDTAANWTANDPTLADGEIGFETDTGKFKIGKSNTAWISLQYAQVAGDDGLSYDIYPELRSDGLSPSQNYNVTMLNYSEGTTTQILGVETLFKAGDWIKAVFKDYRGDIGTAGTVYPDVYFEGYIYEIIPSAGPDTSDWLPRYNILITKINGGSQEGNSINQWTTGLLPEPKATYEIPKVIYEQNGSYYLNVNNAYFGYSGMTLPAQGQYVYGDAGLYQVGQKIRIQGQDEFGVDIAGTYCVAEVVQVGKDLDNTPGVGLIVNIIENYTSTDPSATNPLNMSFSLHASDGLQGLQGPGYEVTWDENVHILPDDPNYYWTLEQTTWKAGDQYLIPGYFVNTAYKIGDYVKHLFNTGTYETDHWIEGWITAINTAGATIRVQRWGNTDWAEVTAQSPGYWRTTYAHFEPGYNFDTYLSENTNAALNDPLSYEYLSYQIQNDPYFYFILRGHLGSYKAGDYVIVSSKSNPLIKFTAYLVHAGLAGINAYTSNFYPIEILSWDGDIDEPIYDWTLSPIAPPEVGYNFPFPLPNPSVATYDTPAYFPPAAFAALASQTYPLSVNDIIEVRGVPGLYEVGDKVRAYDPYDKDAQFYGEVYSLGSASNEWVSEIKVTDPSVFTSSDTNYHPYKISLGENYQPAGNYQLATPQTKNISASPNNITITAEDMGKYIYTSSAANVTITVNPFSLNSLPAGSQVTVIQRAPGTVTITGGGMDSIYFSETDGYTDGLSIQLKGMYSAATIIKSDGYNEWIVIGDLANPVPNNGGGGGG